MTPVTSIAAARWFYGDNRLTGSGDSRSTKMQHDFGTWNLAKLMVEQHGHDALHSARKVAAIIEHTDGEHDSANFVDVVRAMDLLLSEDDYGTVH